MFVARMGCFIAIVLSSAFVLAAPARFSYQGQIIKPDGHALEASSVTFTIEVLSPGAEACVLYQEIQTINMTNSNGLFTLEIGAGSRSGTDYEDVTSLATAISNSTGLVTPTTCASVGSYNPSFSDGRKLRVSFDDGSGPNTIEQPHSIVSVPFAASASSIDGLNSADLLRINSGGGVVLTQANLESVFASSTNLTELLALIGGTSTSFAGGAPTSDFNMNSQKVVNVATPAAGTDAANKDYTDDNIGGKTVDTVTIDALTAGNNGEVLTWTGTQWTSSLPTGDSTKLPLAGGTLSGTLNLGNQDITNIKDLVTGNNATVGNDLTVTNNFSVTGGIGVGTGINSNGTITVENQNIIRFGDADSTALVDVDYVGFRAPAVVTAPGTIWTLPAADGTVGQLLSTDGSGVLSWVSDSSPIATVFGRTGAVTAAASDYDAVQVDNTPGGNIVATNVQAALDELDTKKIAKSGDAMTGPLQMNATNELRFADADSSNHVGFVSPGIVTSDQIWVLPNTDGTVGQYLQTDGSGQLTFAAAPSAPIATVFGRTGAVTAAASDYDAIEVDNTPAGSIVATNVQAALNELDTEKVATTRTLSTAADSGLAGGGDLSANRTLSLDIQGTTDLGAVAVAADTLLLYDASGSALREVTRTQLVLSETEVDAFVNNNGYALDTNKVNKAGDTMTGNLTMNATNEVRLADTDSSHYVGFVSPGVVASNQIWTLPAADGATGQVLQTDGSGNLSFVAVASAPIATVFGRTGTVTSANSDYDAIQVDNTPGGAIAATNVQAALNELDLEKVAKSGDAMTGALSVTGSADAVQMSIQANGTQTTNVNVLELKNSGGTVTGSFRADGAVSAATNLATKSYVDTQVSGSGDISGITTGVGSALTGGVASGNATLQVIVDDSSVEISTNTIQVKDIGITTAKLANDAVTAAKLADTAVTAGSYGSGTQVPSFTVDAQGRLTNAANVAITESDPKVQTLTTAEIDQLENLDAVTITNTQWGYLGALSGAPLVASIGNSAGNVMGADDVPQCTSGQKLQMSAGPTYLWSCAADNDTSDHGALTGRADDDHTQYVLLAGRAGGQSLLGGTASGDDITIESTSDATKGFVNLQPNGGNVGIGTATPARALHVNGLMRLEAIALPGSPATGDIAVDSGDANKLKFYDGSTWVDTSGGTGGDITGVLTNSGSGLSGGSTTGDATLQVVVDDSSIEIATNTIQLKDVGITTAKLADGAVTTDKLSDSGVTIGTYPKVTVDVKGRVTAGAPLLAADIPNLDAAKITSGTFASGQIPDLAASKITSGTFSAARVPNLDAGKITTGIFATARIPNLDASKITSGTLNNARLPAAVAVTTVSADSVTLANGIKIGSVATACDGTTEGTIRYNSTSKRMEFCDSTAWKNISSGVVASVSIGAPSSSLVQSGPVTFTVTYGSGTDSGTISLSGGDITIGGTATAGCSVASVTGAGLTRTVTINGCSGTGTVNISVAASTANSTTGDAASGAGPSTTYNVDNTGPTVPTGVSLGAVPSNLTNTPTISYTASSDVGGSTVASHQTRIERTSDSSLIQNWTTHTSASDVGSLTLATATGYTVYVRAVDALGNIGSATAGDNWTTISDPCLGTPSPGDVCTGGAIYLGSLSPGATGGAGTDKYMTTPGDCTDSATPTCDNTTDTLTKIWRGSSGSNVDIPGLTNYTATSGTGNGATNTDVNYGSANTAVIIAHASISSDSAADWCNNLNYGGYTDWHLPNRYELNLIYTNRASIPGLDLGERYLSSTEKNNNQIWGQDFSNGGQGDESKNNSFRFRCVRRF